MKKSTNVKEKILLEYPPKCEKKEKIKQKTNHRKDKLLARTWVNLKKLYG